RGLGPGAMAGRRMAVRMTMRRRRRRRRCRVILVGGLIAIGAHKLSKTDVKRVEEHTGKTAEELTDEELDQALDDLNIDAEELSDAEWDEVDKADAEEDDYTVELERIADLHEKGILTDEEYAAKKKELLGL
ncbi:MAG: SHOCT domain-containing protein, partial [Chloroflexi bacterium]|nr:SHOCT domain-containing protein [Chloroflexota bacterium]